LLIAGGSDRLFGGNGNDTLDASNASGANRLYGGEGNDRLIAGSGDVLVGGTGEDEFILADGSLPSVVNIVGDFEDGIDRILINNLSLTSGEISIVPEGNNVLISANSNPIAQILGTNSSLLTIDDSLPDSILIN
jgi:Ca2+-binding RTX toxin-like protein